MKFALLAGGCALFGALVAQGAESSLQVATRAGVVEGKQDGAVRAYLGIPYAAAPTGALRWKPPVPAPAWPGVRRATEFGPRPMQPSIYRDMVFRDSGGDEDCLSLNIWTPALGPDARLPVMVWFFGGGFLAGGTSERRQDGAALAAREVVVVTVNYRLGVLGFLVHPELAAESPFHAAGNYGLMDQAEALRWVRDNIAAFGGDPANVTIFGESAGSASVSALMASPLAKGLFHRAIGQSGSLHHIGGAVGAKPRAACEQQGLALARALGAASLAELRALPAQALIEAASRVAPRGVIPFGPTVDGYFLPRAPAEIFAAGGQNDVPLLAGWTRDEAGLIMRSPTAPDAALTALAKERFGPRAEEFLRLYPTDTPERAVRSGAEFAGDDFIAFGAWSWLEDQVRTGRRPVYRYRFDQAPPANFYGQPAGAYHASDILYTFASFDAQPHVPWTPADRAAAELVQAYWVNFARAGDPNGPGLPAWPRYHAKADWSVMHLGAESSARPDSDRARYEFLGRAWAAAE